MDAVSDGMAGVKLWSDYAHSLSWYKLLFRETHDLEDYYIKYRASGAVFLYGIIK